MTFLPLLVGTAISAYLIGMAIFMSNKWTTDAEMYQKCKVIPAEVVLITIPINIGLSMNSESAFRLINDPKISACSLICLVIITILGYTILLSLGKILHARNQGSAFCTAKSDTNKLMGLYFTAFLYISIAIIVATL